MIMEKAIIVENVYKKYKLYNDTKEQLLDLVTPKKYGEEFYALTDVNLEAEKVDSVGYIVLNCYGKSTLSNTIADIVPQTTGTEIVWRGILCAYRCKLRSGKRRLRWLYRNKRFR